VIAAILASVTGGRIQAFLAVPSGADLRCLRASWRRTGIEWSV